jgi:hypothetical protein
MKKLLRYTPLHDRNKVLEFLETTPQKRVLDVGYAVNTWSSKYVTHYADINKADSDKIFFQGDINIPDVWEEIENDVIQNGKFDFCISSHTFEDIVNPYFISKMIEKYCEKGFIAVPSKYQEMRKHIDGDYRGYIHHRYIFNIEGDEFVGYPKLNFIENDSRFDTIAAKSNSENGELQFFWKDRIDLKIINNNYMGPTVGHVLGYYNGLLND